MEEKELQDLLAQVQEAAKKAANEANKAEFETLQKQIEDLKNEANKEEITKEITRLAAELKALQEVGKPTNKVTFISAEKAIKDKHDEYLKASSKEQDKPFRFKFSSPFTTKDAVVVSVGNTVYDGDSENHINVTRNTGIISTIRERIMTYLQNVNTRITPNVDTVNWMEEVDEQGTPIFIAEGADKTQLSVRYEEREARAKVIAVYGKVTTKLMRNLPSLVAYIQRNLIKRLDVITENKLFLATGSGNDPEGIVQYATAFDGGVGVAGGDGLVGKVFNPNVADVIRAASLQVYNSYGIPSAFWVTPDVVAELDTMKSEEDGHYVLPPFRSADGTVIAGVRLIPTNALSGASIDFIGGDLSVINVDFTDQISVEIDRDGNDFTKNLKTILVEQELVQYVSANDTQVLIKGTFDAAMAIIEKSTT